MYASSSFLIICSTNRAHVYMYSFILTLFALLSWQRNSGLVRPHLNSYIYIYIYICVYIRTYNIYIYMYTYVYQSFDPTFASAFDLPDIYTTWIYHIYTYNIYIYIYIYKYLYMTHSILHSHLHLIYQIYILLKSTIYIHIIHIICIST